MQISLGIPDFLERIFASSFMILPAYELIVAASALIFSSFSPASLASDLEILSSLLSLLIASADSSAESTAYFAIVKRRVAVVLENFSTPYSSIVSMMVLSVFFLLRSSYISTLSSSRLGTLSTVLQKSHPK